jgi:hypothetical protein
LYFKEISGSLYSSTAIGILKKDFLGAFYCSIGFPDFSGFGGAINEPGTFRVWAWEGAVGRKFIGDGSTGKTTWLSLPIV